MRFIPPNPRDGAELAFPEEKTMTEERQKRPKNRSRKAGPATA